MRYRLDLCVSRNPQMGEFPRISPVSHGEFLSFRRIFCDPSANHTECITPGFGADHLLAVSGGIGILSDPVDEFPSSKG